MDAKTDATANTKTAQADRRRQELVVPDLRRDDRPGRHRHLASSTARPAMFTYDPGLHLDRRAASPRSPISTATRASCSIAAIRSSSSPSTATSSRPATCCSTANCRPPAQKADFDYRVTHHTMVHEQMSRFFQGFRRDAHPMAVMVGSRRRAVGLLSRLHRHLRSAPAHDRLDPHDREDADARGDGLQIFDRPAVRLSEERPRLRVELPAHVLRGAVRGVQGEPGAGARDGPHLHPARRPRAERLDLDGAARRLLRRQSVRLHRGRHRLPVGPGAWRRQRSGAEDAGRDRHGRPHPGIHQARRRTRTTASA